MVSPTTEATTEEKAAQAAPAQATPAADKAPRADAPAIEAQPSPAAPVAASPAAEAADAPPADKAPAKRGRKPSTARKTRTVELTLTVTGTLDGEWQAEVSHSGSRVVQGLQIPAAAVSRAAAELHEDISKAIESVLDVAREQHQARLAELEAELSKVKQALADLQDG